MFEQFQVTIGLRFKGKSVSGKRIMCAVQQTIAEGGLYQENLMPMSETHYCVGQSHETCLANNFQVMTLDDENETLEKDKSYNRVALRFALWTQERPVETDIENLSTAQVVAALEIAAEKIEKELFKE